MARIHELFRYLKDAGGSDLHLAAPLRPRVRRRGELEDVEGWEPLSDDELLALLREIASDEQWKEYEDCGDLDFAYGLEGVARFRANFLRQENGAAAVFRIIPEKILTADHLGVPDSIRGLADLHQGNDAKDGSASMLVPRSDVIYSFSLSFSMLIVLLYASQATHPLYPRSLYS